MGGRDHGEDGHEEQQATSLPVDPTSSSRPDRVAIALERVFDLRLRQLTVQALLPQGEILSRQPCLRSVAGGEKPLYIEREWPRTCSLHIAQLEKMPVFAPTATA
jgi:hypothetical protein